MDAFAGGLSEAEEVFAASEFFGDFCFGEAMAIDMELLSEEGKLLHRLFEKQAISSPDKIALVDGARSVTYAQLNEQANQFARCLVNFGVKKQDVVAIGLDHSIELIVAILGILKTGAIYITLDVEWPSGRLTLILNDCQPALLVSNENYANHCDGSGLFKKFLVDKDWGMLSSFDASNGNTPVSSRDIAYIVYTSGSTGARKVFWGTMRVCVIGCCGCIRPGLLLSKSCVVPRRRLGLSIQLQKYFRHLVPGFACIYSGVPG